LGEHDNHAQKIRVLVAKPGLDGHDRGAKVIARALRDAGMEVIYTGLRQTPTMIAEAALQEDVDAVGLSILSGAHMALVPRIMDALATRGLDEVPVFLGGIIPKDDIPELKAMGIREVFGPGTRTDRVAAFIRETAATGGLSTDAGDPRRDG
jgi:methylmalonyl-CoA mutase C-terminal domain/subunit